MIKYLYIALLFGLLSSCSSNVDESKIVEASFKVDGMTCEMGCANAIEERLAELSGVEYAEVNFSENKAVVKYSIEILDRKSIIEEVEGLGGGDKYSVSDYTVVKKSNSNNQYNLNKDDSEEIGIEGIKVSNRISFPNIFVVFSIQ